MKRAFQLWPACCLTNVAAANHFVEARCARILLDVLAAELER